MIDMPSSTIVLIFVTFCAAGVVKGVTGLACRRCGSTIRSHDRRYLALIISAK